MLDPWRGDTSPPPAGTGGAATPPPTGEIGLNPTAPAGDFYGMLTALAGGADGPLVGTVAPTTNLTLSGVPPETYGAETAKISNLYLLGAIVIGALAYVLLTRH